jgi:hypothetical protein
MQILKPVDISGLNRGNISKNQFNELAGNRNNKNIRDLYRGTDEFNRGYKWMEMVIWLQILTIF